MTSALVCNPYDILRVWLWERSVRLLHTVCRVTFRKIRRAFAGMKLKAEPFLVPGTIVSRLAVSHLAGWPDTRLNGKRRWSELLVENHGGLFGTDRKKKVEVKRYAKTT